MAVPETNHNPLQQIMVVGKAFQVKIGLNCELKPSISERPQQQDQKGRLYNAEKCNHITDGTSQRINCGIVKPTWTYIVERITPTSKMPVNLSRAAISWVESG